ncbi:MAG: dethiobiotin synthase [Nevskia sp.]|nr:dethiobiotin synthase [Nevskia sp.]
MADATIFVTGTDTGVGKTRIACALLQRLRAQSGTAAGFKPVASGARRTPQGLRNDDALELLAHSTPGLDYAAVNPCCFEPPIAPHLAAREAGMEIDCAVLDAAHARLAAGHRHVVVEGAGGWLVPLNSRQTFADWVAERGWPVLLVVAVRLGCINHALLSAEAIERRCRLFGWVANVIPPAPERLQENIESLRERLPAPLLATAGAGAEPAAIARIFRGPGLFE